MSLMRKREVVLSDEERYRVMLIGVMELARRQYSDLENTRRTTALVLADFFHAKTPSINRDELRARIMEFAGDRIYGDEHTDAEQMAEKLWKNVEDLVSRLSPIEEE